MVESLFYMALPKKPGQYHKIKQTPGARKDTLVKIIYQGPDPQTANILLSNGESHQFQFFPSGPAAIAAETDIPTPPFDASGVFKHANIVISKDPTPERRNVSSWKRAKIEYQDCTTGTTVKSFWVGRKKKVGFYREVFTRCGAPAFLDERDLVRLQVEVDKLGKARVRFEFVYKGEKKKEEEKKKDGGGIKGFWKAVLRVGEKATAR